MLLLRLVGDRLFAIMHMTGILDPIIERTDLSQIRRVWAGKDEIVILRRRASGESSREWLGAPSGVSTKPVFDGTHPLTTVTVCSK
jgi:hypothetical protein